MRVWVPLTAVVLVGAVVAAQEPPTSTFMVFGCVPSNGAFLTSIALPS